MNEPCATTAVRPGIEVGWKHGTLSHPHGCMLRWLTPLWRLGTASRPGLSVLRRNWTGWRFPFVMRKDCGQSSWPKLAELPRRSGITNGLLRDGAGIAHGFTEMPAVFQRQTMLKTSDPNDVSKRLSRWTPNSVSPAAVSVSRTNVSSTSDYMKRVFIIWVRGPLWSRYLLPRPWQNRSFIPYRVMEKLLAFWLLEPRWEWYSHGGPVVCVILLHRQDAKEPGLYGFHDQDIFYIFIPFFFGRRLGASVSVSRENWPFA